MAEKYNQSFGRPHKGLSNPEAYGLTYTEVLELIASGQWRSFRERFNYKKAREKRIKQRNHICPVCKIRKTDSEHWNKGGTRCLDCHGRRPGVVRTYQPGVKQHKCSYCKKFGGCKKLLGRRICISCKNSFRKMLGQMNESQGTGST